MRRARLGLLLMVAVMAAAPAAVAQDAPPRNAQVDITIAVDTTGSMGESIAQARRDAQEIVDDTRARLPGARFAVIDFKDSTDNPEYLVRQPLTDDAGLIQKAIDKLQADGGDDTPEAYNLVFSRVVDDPALGLRAGSRRLLFVIGDAEPHGAAKAELPGCSDRSDDPHGLRTNDVLSLIRRQRITVNMILQASTASTTTRCYRSIAGLSYGNG